MFARAGRLGNAVVTTWVDCGVRQAGLTGLTGALRGIVAHRIVAAYRAASRRHAYDPARIVVACRFHASKSSPPSSTSASACVREPKSTPRAFSHAASLRGSAAR